MIIELPQNFIYSSNNNRCQAYVSDNVLYVYGNIDYEALMYTLTYALKGYDRCYYCGRKINYSKLTMDHVYPRAWGGVSIPENLVPSCKSCNGEKKDMTLEQYETWKKIDGNSKKFQYWQRARNRNELILQTGNIVFPYQWIEKYDISDLLDHINFDNIPLNNKGTTGIYYRKYHTYSHPIIVSANEWCFKGLHILRHAKNNGITNVRAVVLENVIKG